ncbi:MAG: aromatic amino acid lyase, partial [Desulfomonilaceae bacterium]
MYSFFCRARLDRNFPEQRKIAAAMRSLLSDTGLSAPRATWAGQDPYTLRCLPQVLGSVELGLRFAEEIVGRELNAVTDNPVVFESDDFVSGGNFHGQPLALALDTLALTTQYVAAFSERRISRLLHPALNRGLPAFLAPDPGVSSGFMVPQYLAAALVNENVTLVHPASASSLPTSADQEDYVSM